MEDLSRILFSITYYHPYISGLTLYCRRLAEGLAKKGYQCTVISSDFDKKKHMRKFVNKVRLIRVPYLLKISKGFLMPKWPFVSWQEVKKHDIVIINLPQFEGFIPALWARILGKKVISIYHCEVCLPAGWLNRLTENFLHFSNLISLLLSQRIITYTKDYANHSKFLPFFAKKLLFVYPPIPGVKCQVSSVKKERREIRIGFAGRIAAEKGIEYLLEAIPSIVAQLRQLKRVQPLRVEPYRRIQLLIAGPKPVGEERYGRKLQALIKKYKDYLIFTGPLLALEAAKEKWGKFPTIVKNFHQLKTMEDFYQAIDVLVLPSINSTEAFGMVQVEAMLYGVPVVATNLPGMRVPIQKTGMGILVPAKNPQAVAKALVEIFSNRQRYLKPQRLVEKIFNFEETITFYEKLFKNLS